MSDPFDGVELKKAKKRIAELEAPFKNCDGHDWNWLFHRIRDWDTTEQARFWQNRLREFRKALNRETESQ